MAQLHCSAAFVPCLFLSNCPQLTSDEVLKLQANLQREAEPLASSPTLVFWWQGAVAGGQRPAPCAGDTWLSCTGEGKGWLPWFYASPLPWDAHISHGLCWCFLSSLTASACGVCWEFNKRTVSHVMVSAESKWNIRKWYSVWVFMLGMGSHGNGNGKPMSHFAPVARLFPRTSFLVVVLGFPPRALLDLLPVRSLRSHVCMLVEWFVFQLLSWSLAWCLQELQDFSCSWYFWASVEAWRCLSLYLLEGFFYNL